MPTLASHWTNIKRYDRIRANPYSYRNILVFKRMVMEALRQARERPDLWTPQSKNRLTSREKINDTVISLMLDVGPQLSALVDKGHGKQMTGIPVKGRELDDEEIDLDKDAEALVVSALTKSAQKNRLSFTLLSEHGNYEIGSNPQFYAHFDPLDNSDEQKKGLDTPPHVTGAFYDMTGNPIAAVDINLFTLHAFVVRDDKVYEYNLKTGDAKELPTPPEIITIKDPRFVIASYFGRDKYSRMFNLYLDDVNLQRAPKSTFHGKAGAHLYPYMARGGVGLYAMFDEPYGEIFPGLPFATAAGFKVWSVNNDGTHDEVKFDPELQYKTVPFYVVARTSELAEEIIDIAMVAKKEKGLPDW